jgi:electron transport complex protein RnfG
VKKFVDESWLVLAMGIVFAALLAATQSGLNDRIKANEAEALEQAIEEVVPGVKTKEPFEIEKRDARDETAVYKCLDADGKLVGWAVQVTGPGFIDKITLVAGLSPAGDKLTGIKPIKHTETPGLGNKIDVKGDLNFYPLQYAGRSTAVPFELSKEKVRDAKDTNRIEAITGATYSSQYTMEIVNDVITRIRPQLVGHR